MKNRSSVWYSTYQRKNGRWEAAVIIGSPDNEPTVLGEWATELRAAYACARHLHKTRRTKRRPAKKRRHQTAVELRDRLQTLAMSQAFVASEARARAKAKAEAKAQAAAYHREYELAQISAILRQMRGMG